MRDLVQRKIATIATRYHYETANAELGGVTFPRNVTLMALSYLLESNHLIFGDPGWGKTTAAKVLASVFSGVPYDVFDRVEMRGNPQKYEEKTIARPDYGALGQGRESVVWLGALGTPVLVVDELNRFSLEMQDVLLQGVDTGSWQYLNANHVHRSPAFFTANFGGETTNSFIPPLLDRMAVMTEEQYSGAIADYHAARERRDAQLCSPAVAARAMDILSDGGLRAFMDFLAENRLDGVEAIEDDQRRAVRDEIRNVPCSWYDEELGESSNDALLFFYSLVAELNHSEQYGCKRSADPISDDNHDRNHAGSLVRTSLSPRSQMAALDYARGLAWLLGDERVDIEHFKEVLPHVIAHRFEFESDFSNEMAQVSRSVCEELHLGRALVERVHENYLDSAPTLKNLLAELQRASAAGDAAALTRLDPDDYDQPLAKEMIRRAQNEAAAGRSFGPSGDGEAI